MEIKINKTIMFLKNNIGYIDINTKFINIKKIYNKDVYLQELESVISSFYNLQKYFDDMFNKHELVHLRFKTSQNDLEIKKIDKQDNEYSFKISIFEYLSKYSNMWFDGEYYQINYSLMLSEFKTILVNIRKNKIRNFLEENKQK